MALSRARGMGEGRRMDGEAAVAQGEALSIGCIFLSVTQKAESGHIPGISNPSQSPKLFGLQKSLETLSACKCHNANLHVHTWAVMKHSCSRGRGRREELQLWGPPHHAAAPARRDAGRGWLPPSGQAVPQVGALWTAFQMAFQLFLALSKAPGVHFPGRAQLLSPAFAGTEQPRTEPPRSHGHLPSALPSRRTPLAPGPSTRPFLQLFPFQSRHTPSPSGDFPFPTLSSGQENIALLTLHPQPPSYQEEKIPASNFFPI